MKKTLFALTFCLLASAAAAGPLDQLRRGTQLPAPPEPAVSRDAVTHLAADDRYWITVSADDKYDRTALLAAGMDIVEIEARYVSGFIGSAELDQLAAKGFIVKSRQTIHDYAKSHLKDFPAADGIYHNYAETEAELKALAAANPAEASLFSLGRTTEGREIWCLRLNTAEKGDAPSARPAILFMGNHHGREHLTNEVALALAKHLLDGKNEPAIGKFLATLDIYIAPMTNPDGAEYDIATGKYRWHRKNTRVNADKSIGVDLNRNYAARWCEAGASTNPRADTYCGPYAFSEPETRAVRDFILARPNLKSLMSYHSYSSLMLYPWASRDEHVGAERDRKVFETMGRAMGALTGYKPQKASDLYVAAGDTGDWAYETRGVFAFTAELDGTTFYPGAAMIEKAAAKNIKAALYMLGAADDPYKVIR